MEGQSLSIPAKPVEKVDNENTPEKRKGLLSERRAVHFVGVPLFHSEHDLRESSNQLNKPSEKQVDEKQVEEGSSTAIQQSSTAVEQSRTAVEKFNEKEFQSVHNLHQSIAHQQGEPSRSEYSTGGDSNENERFNETVHSHDIKSNQINQTSGKLFLFENLWRLPANMLK